jgi:hypothetical protein
MTTMSGIYRPGRRRAAQVVPMIDAAHREDLEAALALLRAELALEARLRDGELRPDEELLQQAVRAHLGELGVALGEWEARLERARLAPAGLWSWLGEAAAELGVSEPPFLLGPLVDTLAMLIVERARSWELDLGYELALHRLDDRFDGERHASLYLGDRMLARVALGEGAAAEAAVHDAERRLQALFDVARVSGPAREISDSRDSLLALKQHLLGGLTIDAQPSTLSFTSACPICVRPV